MLQKIEAESHDDRPSGTSRRIWRPPVHLMLILGVLVASSTILPRVFQAKSPARPGRLAVQRDSAGGEPTLKAGQGGRLVNEGDSPVRIVEIQTSCGCATAHAHPTVIPPGGSALVEITTTPMDVGVRRGIIKVETDSPETPSIPLNFLVVGDRPPPHVLSAVGELDYRDGTARNEPRSLFVQVVEPRSATPKGPVIRCDLPFVRLDEPKVVSSNHATRGDWIVRKYTYTASLDDAPSSEFAGELTVSHPDDPARLLHLRIHGEESLPFRVTPRHLRLRANGGRPGRLIVKPSVAGSPVQLVTGSGKPDRLIIRPVGSGDESLLMFDVTPGPSAAPNEEIVVSMKGRPERVMVSVAIEGEGRP